MTAHHHSSWTGFWETNDKNKLWIPPTNSRPFPAFIIHTYCIYRQASSPRAPIQRLASSLPPRQESFPQVNRRTTAMCRPGQRRQAPALTDSWRIQSPQVELAQTTQVYLLLSQFQNIDPTARVWTFLIPALPSMSSSALTFITF